MVSVKPMYMVDNHAADSQAFLSQKFLPDKRGTSGAYYQELGDRIRAAIKEPSSVDKN